MRHLLYAYLFGKAKSLGSLGQRTQALERLIAGGGDRGEYLDPGNNEAASRLRAKVAGAHIPTAAAWPTGLKQHVFVKSHLVYSERHPLADEPARAILLVRHPKDVLLSSLKFEQMRGKEGVGDPTPFVSEFIDRGGVQLYAQRGYGTWANHWRSWMQVAPTQMPVLLVNYKTLLADPHFTFAQVLNFLGFAPRAGRVDFAVEAASFENLKALEQSDRIAAGDASDNFFFNHGGSGRSIADTLGVEMDDQFDEAFEPHIDRFNAVISRGRVQVAGRPRL